MKFKILVEHEDKSKEPWWEEFDKLINDPDKWGRNIVDDFNNTLRTFEKPRRFLKAEIIEPGNVGC